MVEKVLADILNVKKEQFEKLESVNLLGRRYIECELKRKRCHCPRCKSDNVVTKGYTTRTISLPNLGDKYDTLLYKQRSYRCKDCNKVFIEPNKIVDKGKSYSIITKNKINKLLVYDNRSFASFAHQLNLSRQLTMKLVDKYIKTFKKVGLSEEICFDEIKYSSKTPKYDFVILDYKTNKIIDIVRDRRLQSILQFLMSFPLEEREKVKIVVIDLWKPYLIAIKQVFPNAKIVVDKFHFSRYITWTLRDLRIKTYKSIKSANGRLLKKYWKLIQTPSIRQNTNFDILKIIEEDKEIDKDFKEMLKVFNYYYNNLNDITEENASYFIDTVIQMLEKINCEEVLKSLSALRNWKNEIVNALSLKNSEGKAYTNGTLEGLNNFIKCVIRTHYGFKKHRRFKYAVMMIYNNKIRNQQ